MTEKRYSFNWERGHPNFWDNHCDLADCYLTCEDVVNRLNELHEEKELEHKRVNYLKKIVAENCPNSLLIQVQNDLEGIE